MAVTRKQLLSIGFVPSKRSKALNRDDKYDTLIYKINSTDYLFTGYSNFTKKTDFKRLWKTIFNEGSYITYPVDKMGELTLNKVLEYIEYCKERSRELGEES